MNILSRSSLLLTFGILLFCISCDVNDNIDYKKNYSYQIVKNAKIVLDTTARTFSSDSLLNAVNFSIEEGSKTVFVYTFESVPPKGIADAGFTKTMAFQIPADIEQFTFKNDSLDKARAYYKFSCYCSGAGIGYSATEGIIKGKQRSPLKWFIQADVTFKSRIDTFKVQFEKPFTTPD